MTFLLHYSWEKQEAYVTNIVIKHRRLGVTTTEETNPNIFQYNSKLFKFNRSILCLLIISSLQIIQWYIIRRDSDLSKIFVWYKSGVTSNSVSFIAFTNLSMSYNMWFTADTKVFADLSR